MMAGIRARNTKPEIAVRSFLHRSGLRFRIHSRSLPGKPDLVLPRWRAVVFVNGCFWHRHRGCPKAYTPKSNRRFWMAKFHENVARDAAAASALRRAGWRVFTIWECQVSSKPLIG
jgi:DNA mismatch endonuclease (patch repair protein)